jgi:hypothetical protein
MHDSASQTGREPQPIGSVRYCELEPLRQFPHARLEEAGAVAGARAAHAGSILAIAERPTRDAELDGMFENCQHLTPEADNIRLALEWALESEDVDLAVRLAASLWMWWSRPDREAQGLWWVARIRALPGATKHHRYGRVVPGHAFLAMLHGEMDKAVAHAEEARRRGDQAQFPRQP